MQTLNTFVNGAYEFVVLQKPDDVDYLGIPAKSDEHRPVLVFWNVRAEAVEAMASALADFLTTARPSALMISGSTEAVWPGTCEHGTAMVLRALEMCAHGDAGVA
jgi:hypothetical protein